MAGHLSISRAWDETKAKLASDGRLMMTVALALVALPSAIAQFLMPEAGTGEMGLGGVLVMIVVTIIGIIGQLAIIRLALGPSITVGSAIGHGARRAPAYVGSILILILGGLLLSIPFILIASVSGATFVEGAPQPPIVILLLLLATAVIIYAAVRMMMSAPVACAEPLGSLAILKRSWQMTSGHWLRLFGFLLLFIIGALVAIGAVVFIAALIAKTAFGEIEPMSASALIVALVEALVSAIATTIFMVMLARMYLQLSGDLVEPSVPSSGT